MWWERDYLDIKISIHTSQVDKDHCFYVHSYMVDEEDQYHQADEWVCWKKRRPWSFSF